jgi:hypothetical protein
MQREREMVDSPRLNLHVIKARAKHFQDSLFSTVKSSNATKMGSISEQGLRKDSGSTTTASLTVSKTGSYRSHETPAFSSHGMNLNTEYR